MLMCKFRVISYFVTLETILCVVSCNHFANYIKTLDSVCEKMEFPYEAEDLGGITFGFVQKIEFPYEAEDLGGITFGFVDEAPEASEVLAPEAPEVLTTEVECKSPAVEAPSELECKFEWNPGLPVPRRTTLSVR